MRVKRFFAQMSIYDLGLRSGIQPSKLSLIERGCVTPRLDEKEKLAEALGCEVEELFEQEGKNAPASAV